MSPTLLNAIISASAGLGGALIGGFVVPYVTYRLNDKSRKLELYKIAYPEIFKAAQKLTNDAHNLERSVWHHQNYETHTDLDEQSRNTVVENADAFIHYVYSIEWLIGSDVVKEAGNFGISAKESVGWQDPEVYPIATCHYTEAYRQVVSSIRKEAHIPTLEQIFP